jgi:hypothetical protein
MGRASRLTYGHVKTRVVTVRLVRRSRLVLAILVVGIGLYAGPTGATGSRMTTRQCFAVWNGASNPTHAPVRRLFRYGVVSAFRDGRGGEGCEYVFFAGRRAGLVDAFRRSGLWHWSGPLVHLEATVNQASPNARLRRNGYAIRLR